MTAAVPRSPGNDHSMRPSLDDNGIRKQYRSRLPAESIAVGALSVASFWVLGLGFLLGGGRSGLRRRRHLAVRDSGRRGSIVARLTGHRCWRRGDHGLRDRPVPHAGAVVNPRT